MYIWHLIFERWSRDSGERERNLSQRCRVYARTAESQGLKAKVKGKNRENRTERERQREREGAKEYERGTRVWVDNEKCSRHLLEQTSPGERDFRITFTPVPPRRRSHSAWKFHFHNLHDGSLSPDTSRGSTSLAPSLHSMIGYRWTGANFYRADLISRGTNGVFFNK